LNEIPLLTAQDVELRVSQLQQTNYGVYATLLVYKDARTDFAMLNKVFGPLGWQRKHCVIEGNLYCTVSVWDEEHQRWIERMDVGVPSNTESEKGAASDSFKRACFNYSLGTELYDAPIIRFKLADNEVSMGSNGKPKTYAKFQVGTMIYDRDKRCFTEFTVLDQEGNVRFSLTKSQPVTNSNSRPAIPSTPSIRPVEHSYEDVNAIPTPSQNMNTCENCQAAIKSPKVIDFSRKKFNGRIYCYACQKLLAA